MTKAISMAIELDQDIIVADRKQSSVRTDKGNPICRHFVGA